MVGMAPGAAASPEQWARFRDTFGTVGGFVQHGYLYAPEPIKTGIAPLDALTGGIRPGLTVIGGEPGAGKSAFALQIAANAALGGRRVLYVSLEMGYPQCMARVLSYVASSNGALAPFTWSRVHDTARQSRLRLERARRDGGTAGVMANLCRGGDPVMTAAAFVQDRMPGLAICAGGGSYEGGGAASEAPAYPNPADIEGFAALARSACGLGAGLVVLDYMQLINTCGQSDYERTGTVSKALTSLANECGVPFVVISSLSREGGKTLDMHAYRGSGQIEYDAGLALILGKGDAPGAVSIRVVKNRHGAVSEPYPLAFEGEHNRFTWKSEA